MSHYKILTSKSAGTPALKPVVFKGVMHSSLLNVDSGRFKLKPYKPKVSDKNKRIRILTQCNFVLTRKALADDQLNPAFLGSRPGGRPI